MIDSTPDSDDQKFFIKIGDVFAICSVIDIVVAVLLTPVPDASVIFYGVFYGLHFMSCILYTVGLCIPAMKAGGFSLSTVISETSFHFGVMSVIFLLCGMRPVFYIMAAVFGAVTRGVSAMVPTVPIAIRVSQYITTYRLQSGFELAAWIELLGRGVFGMDLTMLVLFGVYTVWIILFCYLKNESHAIIWNVLRIQLLRLTVSSMALNEAVDNAAEWLNSVAEKGKCLYAMEDTKVHFQ